MGGQTQGALRHTLSSQMESSIQACGRRGRPAHVRELAMASARLTITDGMTGSYEDSCGHYSTARSIVVEPLLIHKRGIYEYNDWWNLKRARRKSPKGRETTTTWAGAPLWSKLSLPLLLFDFLSPKISPIRGWSVARVGNGILRGVSGFLELSKIQKNDFPNIPRIYAGQTIALRKHEESTRITKSPKSWIYGQDVFKNMFDSFAFAPVSGCLRNF